MKKQTKNKLSHALTVFKGDIFLNSSVLLIESIICAVLLFTFISSCYSSSTTNPVNNFFNYISISATMPPAATIFVASFTNTLIGIGSIFTIIFMAKSLSYLHNKRKLDMYGSMPISRKAFFNSKLFATYIQSTAIIVAFYIITLIIGLCTGADISGYIVAHLFIYLFSTLFTITFYGLCAVCSKGTLGAVVSYFIITMAIPTVVGLARAFITGFFAGANPYLFNFNFVDNVFSPNRKTSLLYIIAWVLLSAGCLLLANAFVKKRCPENAGKKLYVPILEYIIKITLTIIVGTFAGLIHGLMNTKNGAFGFIISFLIVGIATYIIIHIIYNNGEFKKMLSNSIVLAVLMATCIGGFLLCDLNPMGYNNTVPTAENIASAGYLRTNNISKTLDTQLILDSTDDFTEDKDVEKILKIHNELASNQPEYNTSDKLTNVSKAYFRNLFTGSTNNSFDNDNVIIISYKYSNGTINSYKYTTDSYFNDVYYSIYSTENEEVLDAMAELEYADVYAANYRSIFTTSSDNILNFEITGTSRLGATRFLEECFLERTNDKTQDKLYNSLCNDLTAAFKKDFENDKNRDKNCKPFWEYTNHEINSDTLSEKLIINFSCDSENLFSINSNDSYYVPKTYTETIKVLKEYHILNDDFTVNGNQSY